MQTSAAAIQNFVADDRVFVTASVNPAPGRAAEAEARPEQLDPKSARKEAISDMKRTHIMDAAIRVIARCGYASARLEDIAEEAGFSKASIYHYFPDKDALFVHIIIKEQRAVYDKCMEIVARDLPFTESIREFAFAFFERFPGNRFFDTRSAAPSPSMMMNFVTSFSKHEGLLNESIMRQRETFSLLTRVVTKAREAGVLTVPVDDWSVCMLIVSFLQSYAMNNLYREWRGEGGGAGPGKIDFNKAVETLFVFLGPWINEDSLQRRWYDVQNP